MTTHSILIVSLSMLFACGGDDGGAAEGSGSGGTTDSSAGSSGGSGGGGTAGATGAPTGVPADASAAAIRMFLAADGYKGAGWNAETDMPREASSTSSPHGRVQVYLNDSLVASQAAGNDGLQMPHDGWSMAVKELYEIDTLVGKAVMFNAPEGGTPVVTYYCWGPAERCSTGEPEHPEDAALIGQGTAVSCGFCHNGTVFTQLP